MQLSRGPVEFAKLDVGCGISHSEPSFLCLPSIFHDTDDESPIEKCKYQEASKDAEKNS